MRRSIFRVSPIARGVLACASVSVLAMACSDKARLPDTTDNQRTFDAELCELPPRTGGDTFSDLYFDVFSLGGVARCQSSGCHGSAQGQNGLAMQTPKVGGKAPTPGAIVDALDDRGVYCALTTHLVTEFVPSTKIKAGCTGTKAECVCNHGDVCACGAGPRKGLACCNPATDSDTSCVGDSTECDKFCRPVLAMPHTDPKDLDSTPDSALLAVLSPSSDGTEAPMPYPLACNRKLLPEELARIASWLKRGAPYDGPVVQPAYDCAAIVAATPK